MKGTSGCAAECLHSELPYLCRHHLAEEAFNHLIDIETHCLSGREAVAMEITLISYLDLSAMAYNPPGLSIG